MVAGDRTAVGQQSRRSAHLCKEVKKEGGGLTTAESVPPMKAGVAAENREPRTRVSAPMRAACRLTGSVLRSFVLLLDELSTVFFCFLTMYFVELHLMIFLWRLRTPFPPTQEVKVTKEIRGETYLSPQSPLPLLGGSDHCWRLEGLDFGI